MDQSKLYPSEPITYYSVSNEIRLRGEETLEMIIPDRYPDAAVILCVDGQAWEKKREESLQASAEVCALIQSESGKLYTLTGEIPITVRSAGLNYDSDHTDIRVILIDCQAHIVNSRKISFSAEIEIRCTEYSRRELYYISGLGPDTVEKKQIYEGMALQYLKSESFSIRDSLPYPEGKGIIENVYQKKANIFIAEKKVLQDKVLFRINADIRIHYLDPEGNPDEMILTIPFTRVMELPGIQDHDTVRLFAVPTLLNVVPDKGNDSDEISILININTVGMGLTQESIVATEDGYSLTEDMTFKKSRVPLIRSIDETKESVKNISVLEFPEDPDEITDCLTSVSPAAVYLSENNQARITAEISNILFYRKDNLIRTVCKQDTVEWCGNIHTKNIKVSVSAAQQHYTVPIQQKSEIEVDILFEISSETDITPELITEIETKEKELYDRPSVLITTVNQKTTVFDLGKKYSAKPDEIAEANHIDSEALVEPGRRIVIPLSRSSHSGLQ